MENINPAAPAAPAILTTVAASAPQCSKCDARAEFACVWPWGEREDVCATHAMLAQQTAGNLGREVTLTALPRAEQPLTRGERAQLKGEVYALEAEIDDLKGRGLALYNENVELTRQVQAKHVRLTETEAQLADARAELAQAQRHLLERESQHGDLVDEVTRLRTLAKFVEPAPPPPPAGPSSIDE